MQIRSNRTGDGICLDLRKKCKVRRAEKSAHLLDNLAAAALGRAARDARGERLLERGALEPEVHAGHLAVRLVLRRGGQLRLAHPAATLGARLLEVHVACARTQHTACSRRGGYSYQSQIAPPSIGPSPMQESHCGSQTCTERRGRQVWVGCGG